MRKNNLAARLAAFDAEAKSGHGEADGKRVYFKTMGHGKNVCYRRPGSNKK